jgi:hypothetical protein
MPSRIWWVCLSQMARNSLFVLERFAAVLIVGQEAKTWMTSSVGIEDRLALVKRQYH